jgi:hypothetical protein
MSDTSGFYAVRDDTGQLTYWHHVRGRTLKPWPAKAHYGPQKPAWDADQDPETRHALNAAYRAERNAYIATIERQIMENYEQARALFWAHTGRCSTCRSTLTAEDLATDPAATHRLAVAAGDPSEQESAFDPIRTGMDMSAGRRILAHAIRAQDTDPRALLGTADPAAVAERLRAYADALDGSHP